MSIVVIYMGPKVCSQCLGYKRVANTDEHESWKYWDELPASARLAVDLGIVCPIECPKCKGTGEGSNETP